MHVSLTPELEARVKAKLKSGLYNNASEIIREALRFQEQNEDWFREIKLSYLRKELKVGVEQIDQGESTIISSKKELDSLFLDAKK